MGGIVEFKTILLSLTNIARKLGSVYNIFISENRYVVSCSFLMFIRVEVNVLKWIVQYKNNFFFQKITSFYTYIYYLYFIFHFFVFI